MKRVAPLSADKKRAHLIGGFLFWRSLTYQRFPISDASGESKQQVRSLIQLYRIRRSTQILTLLRQLIISASEIVGIDLFVPKILAMSASEVDGDLRP